jgi:tRNA pseudouridine32 synthase / 23S rRNA pseudouridine746 synthase
VPAEVPSWETIRRQRTIFEDDMSFVIDKPPGISVVGERHDTDLSQLARQAGEWAMAAHRIDKVTSGAVLFAKSNEAHAFLTQQFRDRSVRKLYLAITRSTDVPEQGAVELPLATGRKNRVRVAALREHIRYDDASHRWFVDDADVLEGKTNAPSVTRFRVAFRGAGGTLLVVAPLTGRRQQIRVHLAWIGYPIQGDPLFENDTSERRVALHAWQLSFQSRGAVTATAEPPPDFWAALGGSADTSDLLARARAEAAAVDVSTLRIESDDADDW